MTIPTLPQILAVSVAIAALAGLLAASRRLRIRPWVVLLAGAAGLALALLVDIFLHRTNSLGSLAAGVLLICTAGALLSLMVNLVSQRFIRKPAKDMRIVKAVHSARHALAAEAPSDGLMSAQINEIALLNGPPAKPSLTLVKPDTEDEPQGPAPEQEEAEAAPVPGAAKNQHEGPEANPVEELKKLEEGFHLEQERLAHEEEKRRLRERAAKERQERIARREEERRMKEEQQRQASEAQRIRERIQQEKARVAQEEKQRQETEQAAKAAREAEKAMAEQKPAAATDTESWEMEEQRLARELEQRRAEQARAAEAEKLWLEEQSRLAEAEEQKRVEAEQQARDETERLEAERIAREEAERLAREDAENQAREEAEGIERERLEDERIAREETERLAREDADRLAREEAKRVERERLEAERLEQKRLERLEREERLRRIAEAGEYMKKGMEFLAKGMHLEALPWLEKAARLETTNEMKLKANLVIVETLVALGWKAEALKRMQAMRSTLEIDAQAKKLLGELATKLLA